MPDLSDYNQIAQSYKQTDVKPDKQFSTLPTVLSLAGDLKNKTILDLGCGGGFFSNKIAYFAKSVIGVDNSVEQINIAKKYKLANTEYLLRNIFDDDLPIADIVVAPYVINYAANVGKLDALFRNIYKSLNPGGRLIAVVDLPQGLDLKKFGATKRIIGDKVDGAKIKIDLFSKDEFICSLNAVYFTPSTLENALYSNGFSEITWHKPIVSDDGLNSLGNDFWNGYVESSELGYLVATKQ